MPLLKSVSAVTAAPITPTISPMGFDKMAVFSPFIATLSKLVLAAATASASLSAMPCIAASRCCKTASCWMAVLILVATPTASTAALYAPHVAMVPATTMPICFQWSTMLDAAPNMPPMTPSELFPTSLIICSTASSKLEICPVMLLLCASISPPNLLPSLVMDTIAFSTSGNPTLPCSTSCFTSPLVTPNCLASSSTRGMPRLRNWLRSCVYKRPCTIVVP